MQKKFTLAIFALAATIFCNHGFLNISSNPPGAEISIDGIRTGLFTPAFFESPQDTLSVSVHMRDYYFQPRSIQTQKDDTTHLSFTHLPILDTLSVIGSEYFGFINLPLTPSKVPYIINGHIEQGGRNVILPEGSYNIKWDGGVGYYPIDTNITIYAGRKSTLPPKFITREGYVEIVTNPPSANIYIDGTPIRSPDLRRKHMAGSFRLRVEAHGYETVEEQITILPYRLTKKTIELTPVITQKESSEPNLEKTSGRSEKLVELKNLVNFFGPHFWNNPFEVEVAVLTRQHKSAKNSFFRERLSLFNDGTPFLNNYRGLTALDKIWIHYRIFILSTSYSQHWGHLQFLKEIPIAFDKDSELFYDPFDDRSSTASLKSNQISAGVQLQSTHLALAFLFGYSIEEIKFHNLRSKADSDIFYSKTFDNSHKQIIFRATSRLERFSGEIYAEQILSLSGAKSTGWSESRAGILIPLRFHRTEYPIGTPQRLIEK